MKAQLVKTPRYAGGGIAVLMPKLQKAQKGKKPLRYADGGTTSTQYVSNVPPGGEAAYGRLIGNVEELTDLTDPANKPPAYTGERLAQFTPLQQQGFGGIAGLGPDAGTQAAGTIAQQASQRALGTSYTPNTGFTAGPGPQQVGAERVGAQQVGTQNFTQPGVAQQYMNPYMQNVVDIQKREAVRADDIARTARNAQAVGQGAFGGSRQAIVEAEAGRNLAQQQNDIQAQGANLAFQQAQQQFNTDQARGLQAGMANQSTGLQAGMANQSTGLQGQMANQNAGLQYGNQNLEAQRLGEASRQYGATLGLQGLQTGIQGATAAGGIGNTLFNQGLTSAKTQVDAGGLQQQNVQQGLDQAYGQYREDINFPYQQAGFLSDILRGSQGSSRAMYDTQPAPSAMQTLAGLAPLIGGLSQKNSVFGARGGEVKSDAIGRGLARIAPDSVGNFASGGIIGYAAGGTSDWADFDRAPPSRDVGPQQPRRLPASPAARAAAAEVAAAEAAAARTAATTTPGFWRTAMQLAGRTALPLTMGATAAELYGANQDAYDENGNAKVTDTDAGARFAFDGGFTGLVAAPPPPRPAKAKAPEKAKEVPGIDAGTITKKETPAAAAVPGVERVGFTPIAAPTGGGGGGRARTIEELEAARKAAGVDYAALRKEGIAGLERAGALDKKIAEDDAAGLAALHDKMGQASLKREERLKEQGSTLGGDSLIRTGLAILTADPKRGWLAATAAGATVGFAEYTARKEKLDSSLEALLEAREQADFAKGKDMLVAKRAVRTAERDLENKKTEFFNSMGLKEMEGKDKVFNTWVQQEESAKQRQAAAGNALLGAQTQVAVNNAELKLRADMSNAENARQLEVNRIRYGTGAGGKPMTPEQFNDNVRTEADALMKSVFDENNVPYTRARATAEAERIVRARMTGTPAVPSTAGWSKPTTTP